MSNQEEGQVSKLEELQTRVRHLDNELRITREEYEEAASEHLDICFYLERKIRSRTDELDAVNVRLHAEIEERKKTEAEKEALINELRKALEEVKVLRGFLPICASCKKIRDDRGSWSQIEEYIRKHSEAEFSHGICPDCAKRLYPGIHEEIQRRLDKK